MVKLLIYDSCMIVKKETVMPICYDVQVIYKIGELTGKAEPRAASSLLPSALADE